MSNGGRQPNASAASIHAMAVVDPASLPHAPVMRVNEAGPAKNYSQRHGVPLDSSNNL